MKHWNFALVIGILGGISAATAGDLEAGKTVFANQCVACHTTEAGKNGFGPSLAGVAGRKAGRAPNFKYSAAMLNADLVWDDVTLDRFLASSTQTVPGTAMSVAMPSTNDRADLIAYLSTLAGPPTTLPSEVSSLPAGVPSSAGPTDTQLRGARTDVHSWLHPNGDYRGQRFIPLSQINAHNAVNLRPTCIYRSTSATPSQTDLLVYQGVMYLTIDQTIVALDAATCRERWTYAWPSKDAILWRTNRGVALKDGRVIRGTSDGYLIAVDMQRGTLLWSRKLADAKLGGFLSMPPLIVGNEVVIAPAGSEWGLKGWVGAFRLDTGEPLWRFNLVPDSTEAAADSWKIPASREHGGGSVWTALSMDDKNDVLYIPVGNPAPDFNRDVRPGDNLYTDSVVALDVKTGRLLWYKQFQANDSHDWDLSQVSPVFDLNIQSKSRHLIAVSGKDGLLRALDRDTREVLYELPVTTRANVEAAPSVDGVHVCPGPLGGVEWNGPALDASTKTLFMSSVDWCVGLKKSREPPSYNAGSFYYGGVATLDPRENARGWLYAIDATSGTVRWCRQWPVPLVAGVTATAGGVLFTGDVDNNFLAFDARTGRTLYSFNTGGSVAGGVISYDIGGKQYVAATSGLISGWFGGSGTTAVVIFALR